MMFKCTICGLEYKIKPDYCSCGNDTFTEIQEIPEKPANHPVNNFNSALPLQKLLSILIFTLCILLSFTILQIKPKEHKTQKTTIEKITEEIPDIEKIWNSTPPAKTVEHPNIITVYERPLQQKREEIAKSQHVDLNKVKEKKSPPKQQKTQQVQTPVKTAVATATPQQQTKPVQTQSTEQQQQKQTVVKSAPEPVKTMNSKEWTNYKNSLRYALLAKLDLVKIIGEGDCAVEFSLDSNGKLLNRKFVYTSQNKTVNDQVYLMLMKLPVYKTPPSGYNGQTIRIKFYINNGYYEISFMN